MQMATEEYAAKGAEIRKLREQLGMSRSLLAQGIGYSSLTVRHAEEGWRVRTPLYQLAMNYLIENFARQRGTQMDGQAPAAGGDLPLTEPSLVAMERDLLLAYNAASATLTTLYREAKEAARRAARYYADFERANTRVIQTMPYRPMTGEALAERKLTAERIIREQRAKQERDEQRKVIADLQAKLFSIALEADKPKYHAAVNAEINKEMAQRYVRKHVQAFLDATAERVVHANDPLVTLAEEDTQ